jgi:putative transposase
VPGQPLHIRQRGNNRMQVFTDPSDFNRCLSFLRDASQRERCPIHAYVLMNNHLHLLVTPSNTYAVARLMQSVELRYARYFNRRHGRTGTLFEGRYRSSVIRTERYFFACQRYIELNPVHAQIVSEPSSYIWSSFHCNAMGAIDTLVKPHPLYLALGRNDGARRTAYLGLFERDLDSDEIAEMRRSSVRAPDVPCSVVGDQLDARSVEMTTATPPPPHSSPSIPNFGWPTTHEHD